MERGALRARRPRWQRPGWWILGALLVSAGAWWARAPRTDPVPAPVVIPADSAPRARAPEPDTVPQPAPPPRRLVPDSVRVVVEVLNATDRRGLARRAMFYLRDCGFDVVASGGTAQRRDRTLILDRSGRGLAQWVAQAFPGASIEARPDSGRFLDVTVLLGRDWAPPRQPLYP